MVLTCFKTYDIRGRLGIELDKNIAHRIGSAFAIALGAKKVVLGRDVRASSKELAYCVARGLIDQGCSVLDLGLCGTEEMYFATSHFEADGGICITASHNPIDYNGMKMVRAHSAPLDADSGLADIKKLAESNALEKRQVRGQTYDVASEARTAYVQRICQFIDISALKPLKILVNAGHGAAGPTFDAIASRLVELGSPLVFERVFHEPDGTFPQGIPNPLLPENRPATSKAIRSAGADFGVAWDGDFDRCFFFDHEGEFISGEYVLGLLAELFLIKDPGAVIIHDPRVIWNIQDLVKKFRGRAVQSRTGHSFIKQAMRDENAVYGGEISAHHYFRDFAYCDSGMIPWLLIAEFVSRRGPLQGLVANRKARFPSSGEINFTTENPVVSIARVRSEFEDEAISINEMDGLSFDMGDWRFNLRSSNTEPLIRLNVEARGSYALVAKGEKRVRKLLL
jgi:phosphomannomutase